MSCFGVRQSDMMLMILVLYSRMVRFGPVNANVIISSLNNVHLHPAGPLQSQGRSDSLHLVVREAMDGLSDEAGSSV